MKKDLLSPIAGIFKFLQLILEFCFCDSAIQNTEDRPKEKTTLYNSQLYDDGVAAMKVLGFPKTTAERLCREVLATNPDISIDKLISLALKTR